MLEISVGSCAKKLSVTYLFYLPKEKVSYPLNMHVDSRGSFTEVLKTGPCGQFSVNIMNPGQVKAEHWHNTKWELFILVSGHCLIQQRVVGTDEVIEFEVSGDALEAVYLLPGYVHNIINLSQTEKAVSVVWVNEVFDPERADTYAEKVVR